jgi:hypothetical protein
MDSLFGQSSSISKYRIFLGRYIAFPPPSLVLLLGYCNDSSFRLSLHTLFCVTPCTNISPSYSSQSGNTRFRSYATCFSQHFPVSFGPIYTRIHTPITYRTYLFTHLYSKIPGPTPTDSDFLIANHLIRRPAPTVVQHSCTYFT